MQTLTEGKDQLTTDVNRIRVDQLTIGVKSLIGKVKGYLISLFNVDPKPEIDKDPGGNHRDIKTCQVGRVTTEQCIQEVRELYISSISEISRLTAGDNNIKQNNGGNRDDLVEYLSMKEANFRRGCAYIKEKLSRFKDKEELKELDNAIKMYTQELQKLASMNRGGGGKGKKAHA